MLDAAPEGFLAEVLQGLGRTQKRLHPKWFYDRRGSALFEEITRQPEYYPTRVETAILRAGAAQLAALVPEDGTLVELGSGASQKTRLLLDRGGHFGAYAPVDISRDFLLATCDALGRDYPDLAILPVVGDFMAALDLPEAVAGSEKVAFFPGSTIGNLDEDEAVALLARVREWRGIRAFILGADLVKPVPDLIAAYDDAAGVTAAFNLNVLVRIARELGAEIELDAFRHEARWAPERPGIEMHLVAERPTALSLAGRTFPFAAGESILTETCRKYDRESLRAMAGTAGWQVSEVLTDPDERFAVAVLD